jgi:hypothetical protein
MSRLLVLLLLSSTIAATAAEETAFPGIEGLMSAEQYRAAGLDKLTPAEREALNSWLLTYTAVDAPGMLRDNEEVKEAEQSHEVQASIKQPFKGWSGETVFYLDNGQIWRQRLPGNMVYRGEDNRVVIKKNFLGFYKMTHLATGKSVGVKLAR